MSHYCSVEIANQLYFNNIFLKRNDNNSLLIWPCFNKAGFKNSTLNKIITFRTVI